MRLAAILTCLFLTSLAHAAPKPEAELRKLADAKFEWLAVGMGENEEQWAGDGAGIYFIDGLQKPQDLSFGKIQQHTIDSFVARVSPDGQAAVVSYTIRIIVLASKDDGGTFDEVSYRVTELAKKTKDGWRTTDGFWSQAEQNADVNQAAKAGKLSALKPLAGGGETSLLDAFTKLTTGPFDDAAAKRKDLVAFGSGPKERTVGGGSLAKAWAASWANKIKIDAAVASNDPKATLGYVIANITLQKTGYTVPFRVMFVFERKTNAAPWSVVHAHFAVPAPN